MLQAERPGHMCLRGVAMNSSTLGRDYEESEDMDVSQSWTNSMVHFAWMLGL